MKGSINSSSQIKVVKGSMCSVVSMGSLIYICGKCNKSVCTRMHII